MFQLPPPPLYCFHHWTLLQEIGTSRSGRCVYGCVCVGGGDTERDGQKLLGCFRGCKVQGRRGLSTHLGSIEGRAKGGGAVAIEMGGHGCWILLLGRRGKPPWNWDEGMWGGLSERVNNIRAAVGPIWKTVIHFRFECLCFDTHEL